jgi:GrpB-like predicted nucleotidyltransferase (UPF0157 family)
MRTKHVVVLPYDERWAVEFEKIKAEIESVLGDCINSIEHVGSTSVKGLSAKPIIDIDVVIPNYDCFKAVNESLAKIGYQHEGDLGIKEREAYKYEDKEHLMKHHLYVCPRNSEELHRHIVFRDYLRKHEEAVYEYSKVKEEAAQLYPTDIDGYMEHKKPCIEAVYMKCGLL